MMSGHLRLAADIERVVRDDSRETHQRSVAEMGRRVVLAIDPGEWLDQRRTREKLQKASNDQGGNDE